MSPPSKNSTQVAWEMGVNSISAPNAEVTAFQGLSLSNCSKGNGRRATATAN